MTLAIDLLCPIRPYELDKRMRSGFNDLVQRVTTAAVLHNEGRDLLLYIYLAGVYHGVELQKARARDSRPSPGWAETGTGSGSEASRAAVPSGNRPDPVASQQETVTDGG